jgi:hypothetical protein
MSACVLTFHQTGTGTCFYSELIDLQTIGSLEVTRATTITFNNQTQFWEVKDTRGIVLYFNRSRTACLGWEQQDFNR